MYFIGTIMHPQLSNFYYSRNVKITIISNMVQQIKLVFFFLLSPWNNWQLQSVLNKYHKIPKVSPSKYKPPELVMQKPFVKSPLQI